MNKGSLNYSLILIQQTSFFSYYSNFEQYGMRLRKRQRAKHEDVQYYYEYISSLQKKMALPMLSMNHGGFVNESRRVVDEEKFSDITLRIQFDDICGFPMSIDICIHRVILSRKSAYFDSLFGDDFSHSGNSMIPLRVALHYDDAPIVKEFFRLFYEPIFEDSHFTTSQYEYIVTNALSLYQMSEQFLFHALRKYCKHKIFERFDISLFSTIFNYCVTNTTAVATAASKPLYVIPGRESLFKRLISWFVCCADVHGSQHPFINVCPVDDDDDDDDTMNNTITGAPNSFIPPPQEHTDEESRKRRRPSGSNDKKIETQIYMRNMIENFDQYDLYSFFIHHDTESRTTRIRSFGRLCEACVHNKSTIHIARINQLMPDNTRRKWHFYLELAKHDTEISSLYAQVVSNDGKNKTLQCQTRITVLSKLYKNKTQVAIPVISSLESFTDLHQFSINEPEFCYHGECDVCHASQTRLFIVKYEIDATTTLL